MKQDSLVHRQIPVSVALASTLRVLLLLALPALGDPFSLVAPPGVFQPLYIVFRHMHLVFRALLALKQATAQLPF
jgi:hypothetical protein